MKPKVDYAFGAIWLMFVMVAIGARFDIPWLVMTPCIALTLASVLCLVFLVFIIIWLIAEAIGEHMYWTRWKRDRRNDT